MARDGGGAGAVLFPAAGVRRRVGGRLRRETFLPDYGEARQQEGVRRGPCQDCG